VQEHQDAPVDVVDLGQSNILRRTRSAHGGNRGFFSHTDILTNDQRLYCLEFEGSSQFT
jgi:hypothetical protein